MKYTKRILVSMAMAFALADVSIAQAPPARPAKTIGKANIYHFRDRSRVESQFLTRNNLKVKASYDVPGPKITRPISLTISLEFMTGPTKPKTSPVFAISADKKELFTGPTKLVSELCLSKNSNPCYEVRSTAPIPYEILEKALKAKSVSINFAGSALDLSADEIRALADMDRAIGSQ